MAKKVVAVLFGGQSAEHEISLRSASNVVSALDQDKYELRLVGIAKDGTWHQFENDDCLEAKHVIKTSNPLQVQPGGGKNFLPQLGLVDVVFPVLHGPNGEDGSVQGLANLIGLPCVGSGVLGSAACMDKDVMKRLFLQAGLKTAEFACFRTTEEALESFHSLQKTLGHDLFVKPANMGSSVGIGKATCEDEYVKCVRNAFQFDSKILVERSISGRELETAVVGNRHPKVAGVGEIFTPGFYTYEAKYVNHEAKLMIPADILEVVKETIQEMAKKAFVTLECRGYSRVDFFLENNKDVLINEINTIPGFTSISMFPKLWEHEGVSYRDLVSDLIELAVDEFSAKSELVV